MIPAHTETLQRSWRVVVSVLLATAFFAGGAVAPVQAQKKEAPPVAVRVAPVKVVDFHDRVEALGTLRAKESVSVTATVTDIVSKIYFDDGQRVEKGQVLVEMSAVEENAQMAEIESTVAEAEIQYDRTKGLAKRKLIAATVLDERRRLLQTSKAQLNAMKARLSDRSIRAPFSGVVGLRNISVGALVEPGTVIVDIADDRKMKLDFSVPSTFVATLKPGLPIVARARGFAAEDFRGKVTSIDNRIDPVTRTIRVRAILPNEDRRLVPGLLMQIDLIKNPRLAKVIPEEAIVPIGDDVFVFVVDPKKKTAERRSIKTGARRLGTVEVLEGLEPGDIIVTHGTQKVRAGRRVIINNTEFERITPPAGETSKAKPPAAASRGKSGGAGSS